MRNTQQLVAARKSQTSGGVMRDRRKRRPKDARNQEWKKGGLPIFQYNI